MDFQRWIALTALSIMGISLSANAEEDECELEEAEIFFEFNAEDLDLGIQALVDGDAWKELKIEGPDGEIFEVEGDGEVKILGLTEFHWESAEPGLVADPDTATEEEIAEAIAAFLDRFPEGEYEFHAETVDGCELHGEAELTHDLLDEPDLDISAFPTVAWVPDPDAIEYEVVVEAEVVTIEGEEEEERVFVNTAVLDPVTNMFTASADFLNMLALLEADGAEVEIKVELICKEESGNKTSTEQDVEND